MRTYSVLLAHTSGRFVVYIVEALNTEIAVDACIRSELLECPEASFRMNSVSEISLSSPMKIMDSST